MAVTSFVVDTSSYSAFYRGDSSQANYFIDAKMILVPVIVIAELRSGFLNGTKYTENNTYLESFLNQANVSVLEVKESTATHYAQIFANLCKAGKPIGTNDIWIAALCIEHDLPLLTKDNDFIGVANLKLL